MQLALGALAKVGGLLAGGGAAGGSGLFTGLSVASSLLGAFGTIKAGQEAARQSRDMATQTELQAGQDKVEATQRQTQMKRTLLQVLGENDVTFAAAGIDVGSGGIASSARQAASERASDELTIDRRDSDFRRALLKMRASGYRRQAGAAQTGALLGAAGGLLNTGLDIYQRGAA